MPLNRDQDHILPNEVNTLLVSLIRDSDILIAMKSFHPLKAPGSDGLHPLFFQKFWDIVGDKQRLFAIKTSGKAKFPKNLAPLFFALFPNVQMQPQ